MKGKILVTIQFTCLMLFALATNWPTLAWWVFILLAISGFLAFWAMAVLRIGNFNAVPTPVENGVLVTRGPYKVIRHPMYTSIFIFASALLAGQFDYIKLIISIVLVAGLVFKMLFEESLLCNHHPGYKAYMAKTKRVIPFVW
jgi:protein-S-isoprenylcysteine O-methyltransferase Ste14